MAISKKGRRRIVVGGREYLWWVTQDRDNYDAPGAPTLRVVSTDKRVLVSYVLAQAEEARHVFVRGPEFRGTTQPGRSYRCPAFGLPGEIRPGNVAEFITWCTEPGQLPDECDWQGNPVVAA
ncbi:hypothetical protein [Nocardia goodfellowii]|uniref:Uncharacterized protein n=1 Tax=Nocardia goodfellowii TaxID=882446 RepID=A0ABS4QGA1_9NOCA|nr:hypothetical protein [Nocardia goodfellowii]MBP2190729.1 hypothetical protein [Nocardia goodfellowii]